MASIFMGGKVRMNPEIKEKANVENMTEEEIACMAFEDDYTGYPFCMPTVYLDGMGEEYFPQMNFSWSDDAVILIRNNIVTKFIKHKYTEILAKNEEGNIVWMDGRSAPYSSCWGGKYLDETRDVDEFEVIEYNPITSQKKRYKVTLEETTPIDETDKHILEDYIDVDAVIKEHQEKLKRKAEMETQYTEDELPF